MKLICVVVVGIGNHKFFALFIFYTCLSAVFSAVLIINRVINCSMLEENDESPDNTSFFKSCRNLYTPYFFMLAFETLLFFSFTGNLIYNYFRPSSLSILPVRFSMYANRATREYSK
jgi:hypothetical protein